MCVGHPKTHPCQHTSVTFNHCVAAQFNPETGRATACDDTTYAAVVETNSKCPNQLCFFEELGRVWTCCQCGNGPNVVGWCAHDRPRIEVNAITGGEEVRTECEHCCCGNCTAYCEFCLLLSGWCLRGTAGAFCLLADVWVFMQMGEAVVVVVPRKEEEEGGRPGKRSTAVLRRGPVRRAKGHLLARRRVISGSRRTMAPEAARHRTRRERIRSSKLSILSYREEGSGGKAVGFLGRHSDFLRYRASDPEVIFCDAEGRTGGLTYTRVETQCSGFDVGAQDRRTLRCTTYLGTESLL